MKKFILVCAPVTSRSGYGAHARDLVLSLMKNENYEVIPVNLMCEDLQWDLGDCDEIDYGCPEGQLEDCNGNCAPDSWLGDGFCDDGSYSYNGNDIFFNC